MKAKTIKMEKTVAISKAALLRLIQSEIHLQAQVDKLQSRGTTLQLEVQRLSAENRALQAKRRR